MYTKEQQKANRERLIKALRSGKYKKATNRLATALQQPCVKGETSYTIKPDPDNLALCVLGVACDLTGLGEWQYVPHDPDCGFSGHSWMSDEEHVRQLDINYIFGSENAYHEPPDELNQCYGFKGNGVVVQEKEFFKAFDASDSHVAIELRQLRLEEGDNVTLTRLNDEMNLSFELMADFIEEFGQYFVEAK